MALNSSYCYTHFHSFLMVFKYVTKSLYSNLLTDFPVMIGIENIGKGNLVVSQT